jgi:hypothetical protein
MDTRKWYQKKRIWIAISSLAAAGMYAADGNWPEAARSILTALGLAG